MEGRRTPLGLLADLVTPIDGDGGIDGRGLARLLERTLPHVHGILLAGPGAGEGECLDPAVRVELVEKAAVVVRGRIPILVWISADSARGTIAMEEAIRKSLEKRRYDHPVFFVDTPLYYHSNRGLPQYYRELCASVLHPLILHNDPQRIRSIRPPFKRANIRTFVLKELAEIPGVAGLIFAGSLERGQGYQRAVRARTDFRIYDGDEERFLSHPSTSGLLSVGANLLPQAWRRVVDSSVMGGGREAEYPNRLLQIWELGQLLTELHGLVADHPAAAIKQVLFDLGLIQRPDCLRTPPPEEFVQGAARRIKALLNEERGLAPAE